jgi:hypothetical protein
MYTCVHFEFFLKNELNLFSFGQSMKNIIMVKVGYFCTKQRMMWDNVEMFLFIKFIPYPLTTNSTL